MKLNYFNYKKFHGKNLLTNDLGKHVFLSDQDFKKLLTKKIDLPSNIGIELLDKGFIYDESDLSFSENSKYCIRQSKSHLLSATSLHIFVVTTACNMNCIYCQANSGTKIPNCYMDTITAEKAVDIALQSPDENLNFEFQGGETLLNFPVIKHIVEYTEEHNTKHIIEYNIVTNLTLLDEEMIDFFLKYHFSISTSLDGNQLVHNANRPFKNGDGTFDKVKEGVRKLREKGLSVGAIETTTRYSLDKADELVDAYLELGFDNIFIRHLTRLGKAGMNWAEIGYDSREFLDFYRSALSKIIELNKKGVFIREQHATILLKRIFGMPMNYMELRSPCGGGVGQLAYFVDGRVFSCDEGRMMAEMGYEDFMLGNVNESSYQDLIKSASCHAVCASSILESIPSCCDCVYQPYCGTCPVVNFALNNDIIEKNPRSFRCLVYSGILDYLFELLLENDEDTLKVLNSWST